MNLKIILSEVLSKSLSCMIPIYETQKEAKSVLEKIRTVAASKAWGQELTRKGHEKTFQKECSLSLDKGLGYTDVCICQNQGMDKLHHSSHRPNPAYPVSVNTVLLEHNHTHSFKYYLRLPSCCKSRAE